MLANETFLRDLPELLAHHRDEFVLYQGGQRLGISVSPWPLETQCGALQAGTAAVFWIREQDDPGEDMTPAF